MKITVVLPAYNEESDLPLLLHRIGDALGSAQRDYRILIVDDGSRDGTVEVSRAAAQILPIELLQHPHNLGLGAAIRTGLTEACKQDGVVITMDADNSQDPTLIPTMVERICDGFDVVIASRFQKGGQEIGVAPHRLMLSHGAGRLMRLAVRFPGVRDYSCGYRAYTSNILRRLQYVYGCEFIHEDGFACMFELLVKRAPI